MTADFRIAIVGSGPAGLSAAARAAQLGIAHVLLEKTDHLSDTHPPGRLRNHLLVNWLGALTDGRIDATVEPWRALAAEPIAYAEEMPTMQVWRRLNDQGKLNAQQKLFFAPVKPREELYNVSADPHEVHNLAGSPAHQAVLKELRAALDRWIEQTHDLGAVPEAELIKRGLVKDVSANYADRKRTAQ